MINTQKKHAEGKFQQRKKYDLAKNKFVRACVIQLFWHTNEHDAKHNPVRKDTIFSEN